MLLKIDGPYKLVNTKSILISKYDHLLQITDDNTKCAKITEFLDRVTNLSNYVLLWSGDNMTFQGYYDNWNFLNTEIF
jgi:hypothetical protein